MRFVAACAVCGRRFAMFTMTGLAEIVRAHVPACEARAEREAKKAAADAAQGVLPL